jgi:hypothetical protein
MSNKPKYTEMRDVDICVYYQQTEDSTAWEYIVKKYNYAIRKLAKQMHNQTLSVCKGLEWDDCYIEACVQTQKAMLYVNPEKISLPYDQQDKAVSTYISSYCNAWIKNQWNSATSKKQGYTRDAMGQIVSPEQEANEVTANLTVQVTVENEVEESFINTFKRELQGVEKTVYDMLNLGYQSKEIRKELKINPQGYKTIFDGIHMKFLALKEKFVSNGQIVSL